MQSGDNVLIAGLIITGNDAREVMLRAIGPSMNINGTPVEGRLADTVLELYDDTGTLITRNDNWKDDQRSAIESTGLAPADERESAIYGALPPGTYTAIVSGKANSSGLGLVEIYDLTSAAGTAALANISTRGFVETGDGAMIGGFIAGGGSGFGAAQMVVRAIGPSLTEKGVPSALPDPTLELYDRNGSLVASNDDWNESATAGEIESIGLAPTSDRESALLVRVSQGAYTAVVRGKGDTIGVALDELYNVAPRE